MENYYRNCLKELDIFVNVTPTIIDAEKERFFFTLNNGEIYNPVFTYRHTITLADVEKLITAFQHTPKEAITSHKYHSHFEKQKKWITTFTPRHEVNFPKIISDLYTLPFKIYELLAQQILEDPKITEEIKYDEAIIMFENTLKESRYAGWQVVIKPIGAKAMISSLKKELIIKEEYHL